MSGRTWLGAALVIVGIIALAYQGFSYTVPKKEVEVGPIHVTKEEKHTIPLPPILGVLALLGGVALVITERREK